MDFNYSYRAFLITSLLTGSLVLFLVSIKLSKEQEESDEKTYKVVMAPEEIPAEELDIAALSTKKVKVETNQAYNEAEKFISSIENEDSEITETTEGKLKEINEALENSKKSSDGLSTSTKAKEKKEKNKKLSNSMSTKNNEAVVKGGNRNTTISYQLINRKDIELPNPVYTCSGSGKVVINVEVDNLGKVTKNSYNKSASSTTNECLIDAALNYSKQALFNTDALKNRQLGTITFSFPGQ